MATVQSAPIRWNEDHPRVWYMFCPRCRAVGQSWHTFESACSDMLWHTCDADVLLAARATDQRLRETG